MLRELEYGPYELDYLYELEEPDERLFFRRSRRRGPRMPRGRVTATVNPNFPGAPPIVRDLSNNIYRSWLQRARSLLKRKEQKEGGLTSREDDIKTALERIFNGKPISKRWLNFEPDLARLSLSSIYNIGILGPPPGNFSPERVPGRFYQIKRGDNLSTVTKAAYGSAGIQNMRKINCHPYNQRFRRKSLVSQQFPDGRISFNPRFPRPGAQLADGSAQYGKGRSYAMIFIPLTSYVPPPGCR